MNRNLATIFLLLTSAIYLPLGRSLAQPPDTLWTQTFGGNGREGGSLVQQTADGGFVIIGYTTSSGSGNFDVWLIKTDLNGNAEWNRTFGGSNEDCGHAVRQTDDGGYIITGYTGSIGAGSYDVWLIKTDSNGFEQWSRTFGGNADDKGHNVQQTDDGGYIIGGETMSYGAGGREVWLIKTDNLGNELWNRTFGGTEADYCHGLEQTSDGGYIVAGPTSSFGAGNSDFWMIKTDSLGNEQWNRTFGGILEDNCHAVQQTDDGGYILAGCSWSFGCGGCDYLLIKTDPVGNEMWSRTLGGNYCDCCYGIQQTSDRGYVLSGWSYSYSVGGCDFWIVKTDSIGDEEWNLNLGGNSDDHCQCAIQTDNGGYVLTGHVSSFGAGPNDLWLVRLEGPPLFTKLNPSNAPVTIPANGGSFDFIFDIINNTSTVTIFDAWIDVILPGGGGFGPILIRRDLGLASGGTIERSLTQSVGSGVQPGQYIYNAYVGNYPDSVASYSGFAVTKEDGSCDAVGTVSDFWYISGWCYKVDTGEDQILTNLSLSSHPNPFNHTTWISFELPEANFVRLEIFDISGRNVGMVFNSVPTSRHWFPSGTHQFTLDGSDLPSGIYFVHIQSGDYTAFRKMVMMK